MSLVLRLGEMDETIGSRQRTVPCLRQSSSVGMRCEMIIRTREFATPKSIEEAMKILKSASYYWPEGIIEPSSFSFCCIRRHGRSRLLIPVRASMREEDGQVTVVLEVHAGLSFYVGCFIALCGSIWTIYLAIMQAPKWYVGLLAVLVGGIGSCYPLLIASEIFDLIEFKLCGTVATK